MNATPLSNMPGGLRYDIIEQADGWSFRCREAGPDAFDSIIDHPVFPTREAAEAAARSEAAGFVALERKQAAIVAGAKIGEAMARDVIADHMPREWTGLDPQDSDQIPADLADMIDEVEYAARRAYRDAIERADA